MKGKHWGLLAIVMILSLIAIACGSTPTSMPTATPSPVPPTDTPVPPTDAPGLPTDTPVPPVAPSPGGGGTPDPRTDPAGALRYTGFPASLGSVGFTSTFRLTADPETSWVYGMETARSFGTFEVMDSAADTIDMELHINFTVSGLGQDMHVIRLGDRAWVRGLGLQWQELAAEGLTSGDWERTFWGGWYPLNALEPFDSATEVEWVGDSLLDGEPAHHLHVVFEAEKMQHLPATAKARSDQYWVSLLHEAGGMYGVLASVDVQGDVWLAAEDLAVKQITMVIQIVTQEDDSGTDKTEWTITRTIQFDAEAPDAIAEPVLGTAGAETDCSRVTEITEAECRTLVALFEDTGGEEWKEVEGWLADNQPCTWGGVTCRGRHVLWLILSQAGLSGALPPEVGDLQWLQVLSLNFNDLKGPLPPELGALGDLQALDLEANFGLRGPLPDEFGNLRSLQELNLAGTLLEGPLPEGSENMRLTYMDLGFGGLCVPDDPSWRDWVESIAYLGPTGFEPIYCTQ